MGHGASRIRHFRVLGSGGGIGLTLKQRHENGWGDWPSVPSSNMSDDCWVAVVRAWSQENERSNLLIRMITPPTGGTYNRHFTSIDEAVEQLRQWLTEFERSVDPTVGPSTTRRPDDADETRG